MNAQIHQRVWTHSARANVGNVAHVVHIARLHIRNEKNK